MHENSGTSLPLPAKIYPGQDVAPRQILVALSQGLCWNRSLLGQRKRGKAEPLAVAFSRDLGSVAAGMLALGAQAGSSCDGEMLQTTEHEGENGSRETLRTRF